MPWLINHKCSVLDVEVQPYSMLAGNRSETGEAVTRVLCPSCREEFIILGHDFFKESNPGRLAGLPPGFVIAKTRTP